MRDLVLLSLLFSVLSSLHFSPRFESIFQSSGFNETVAEEGLIDDAQNIGISPQEYVDGCEALLNEFWTEPEVVGNLYYFFTDAIRKRTVFNSSEEVLDLLNTQTPRSYEYLVKISLHLKNISSKLEPETQSFLQLVKDYSESGFLAVSKAFDMEIDLDEREDALYIVGMSYNRIVFAHTWLSSESSRELEKTFCISSLVRISQEIGGPNVFLAHFFTLVEEASRFAVGLEQIQKALT